MIPRNQIRMWSQEFVTGFRHLSYSLETYPHTDVTLSKLKQVLAAEEAVQLTKGQKPLHDITPNGFFCMAVDIEERQ